MPFDILKVDKTFIDAIDDGAHGGELLEAVVNIGRVLSLVTIAEGIEQRSSSRPHAASAVTWPRATYSAVHSPRGGGAPDRRSEFRDSRAAERRSGIRSFYRRHRAPPALKSLPMRFLSRHMTFANVASLMALIFSMSGGALAARHYLIHSTNQISPKVLRKLKGAPGEIGPIGPQGPTGLTGPKGPNGGRGEPAPSVLATGASETGDFSMRGSKEVGGGVLAEGLSFRIPLPAALGAGQVKVVTEPGKATVECPGPGLASKGLLCIYTTVGTEVGTPAVANVEGTAPVAGSGRYGFTLGSAGNRRSGRLQRSYTVTGS